MEVGAKVRKRIQELKSTRSSDGRVLNHPSVVVDLAQVIAEVRCQVNQKILGGHGYFENFFRIGHGKHVLL
jgi:hypothetical protein